MTICKGRCGREAHPHPYSDTPPPHTHIFSGDSMLDRVGKAPASIPSNDAVEAGAKGKGSGALSDHNPPQGRRHPALA